MTASRPSSAAPLPRRPIRPRRVGVVLALVACVALPAWGGDPVLEWASETGGVGSQLDSLGRLAVGDLHQTSLFAPDGTLLWTDTFDIPGDHTQLTWLAVDSTDHVIRGGYQEGAAGGYLVVKYDPAGNLVWSTLANGIGLGGQAKRTAVDEFDDIYLFGEATLDFSKRWLTMKISRDGPVLWHAWGHVAEPKVLRVQGGQVVVTGSEGGGDFRTTSYDYAGNELWDADYQPGTSGPNDMVIGDDGQVALCGWGLTGTPGESAGTVVQYDSGGQQQWATLYNGPYGGIEIFHRMAYDDTGALVAVGYGLSETPSDAWSIVKLGPDGAVQWTALYDNVSFTGWEYAHEVTIGPARSVYVGGLSDRGTTCGAGSLEGQVVKYDADGQLLWHAHLPCASAPNEVLVDGNGGVFAVTIHDSLGFREPFVDVGAPLAGSSGEPRLDGAGTLLPGEAVTFTLADARPDAGAFLVVGLDALTAAFKGGTLVPSPDVVVPLVVDAAGGCVVAATWPPGLPAGLHLFAQDWIDDPAGPLGWAASNAVQLNP